jgi:hypothetical protein
MKRLAFQFTHLHSEQAMATAVLGILLEKKVPGWNQSDCRVSLASGTVYVQNEGREEVDWPVMRTELKGALWFSVYARVGEAKEMVHMRPCPRVPDPEKPGIGVLAPAFHKPSSLEGAGSDSTARAVATAMAVATATEQGGCSGQELRCTAVQRAAGRISVRLPVSSLLWILGMPPRGCVLSVTAAAMVPGLRG